MGSLGSLSLNFGAAASSTLSRSLVYGVGTEKTETLAAAPLTKERLAQMGFYDSPGVDGRRTSNPLLDPSCAPLKAPKMQLWRHVTTDDAALVTGALPTITRGGANFGSYLSGVLHVIPRATAGIAGVPGGTSQVAIRLLEWSPGRNAFIDTGVTVGTTGAGLSASYTFDARCRLLWFRATGIVVTESASLYISASDEEER